MEIKENTFFLHVSKVNVEKFSSRNVVGVLTLALERSEIKVQHYFWLRFGLVSAPQRPGLVGGRRWLE